MHRGEGDDHGEEKKGPGGYVCHAGENHPHGKELETRRMESLFLGALFDGISEEIMVWTARIPSGTLTGRF